MKKPNTYTPYEEMTREDLVCELDVLRHKLQKEVKGEVGAIIHQLKLVNKDLNKEIHTVAVQIVRDLIDASKERRLSSMRNTPVMGWLACLTFGNKKWCKDKIIEVSKSDIPWSVTYHAAALEKELESWTSNKSENK